MRTFVTLLRWLGPWAGEAVPRAQRSELALPGPRRLRAYRYAPEDRRPIGAYVIAPGLHFLGPDDPRSDRFCRVLAAAGLTVLAPFLPDYLALRIAPRAATDLAIAWEHHAAHAAEIALAPPAIFSISFGSGPALSLAGDPAYRERVGPVVVFGGFADFDATVRFAVTGRARQGGEVVSLPHDPLNAPAVFLNLLPWLAPEGDREALGRAWLRMVERTWNRMELKLPGARDPHAHAVAAELPARLREPFLIGCGLAPGAGELVDAALAASGDAFRFFDPRPALGRLRTEVVVVHGRDDDVIPWFEAEKIVRALPAGHPHRLLVTGMYGHTGAAIPRPAEAAREVRTLLDVVRAMADAPRGIRA